MIKIIFSLFIMLNILYSKNIIDESTKLMWQDSSIVQVQTRYDGIYHCDSLILDNHTDWYLPTLSELTSIVDINKFNPSSKLEFNSIKPTFYMSYTKQKTKSNNVSWLINFLDGTITTKTNSLDLAYVRCVRALK